MEEMFANKGIITGVYTSYWERGVQFDFPCKVNLKTKEVFDIKIDASAVENCNYFLGGVVNFNGESHEVGPVEDGVEYWYSEPYSTTSITIIVRDCNGKRENLKFCNRDEVLTYAMDEANFTEEDEILVVSQDGICLYSSLQSNKVLTADDITGFFA